MTAAGTILIIEDDADTRLGLSVRFRASGYTTLVAGDGEGGVLIALREEPDLVVLDLGLPGGDGFLVLEWLNSNAKTRSIPVIVLSARDPTLNRPKAIMLGAKAYFQKPVEPPELLAEVKRHLVASGEVPVAILSATESLPTEHYRSVTSPDLAHSGSSAIRRQ